MSSCFLCDCSYAFLQRDYYDVLIPGTVSGGDPTTIKKAMKQLPIMVGSSGTKTDDQQHDNNKKQNYVSYRVKKIEFCFSERLSAYSDVDSKFPDYVLIFKVPIREPIFDYYFYLLESFMLYSEPECVLGYKIIQPMGFLKDFGYWERDRTNFKIEINKPFILGPNEYLGVFYMFSPLSTATFYVGASAKVWFDTA